jgi:putative membrane protein
MHIKVTEPAQRNYPLAALVGLVVGIIGAIVKFGWEIPFPPRTPARDATNPPQALLEMLGMSTETSHITYEYLGNPRPVMSFIVHFGFSIAVAVFYVIAAEKYPQITLWQGVVFGVVVWFVFHVVLMPLMGVVPAPWDQPPGEHFSEIFGHAFWLWIMELCRRDLRNRITHAPDPAVP